MALSHSKCKQFRLQLASNYPRLPIPSGYLQLPHGYFPKLLPKAIEALATSMLPGCRACLLICTILLTLRLVCSLDEASEASRARREEGGNSQQDPLVMVGVLARNTAHTLPNFLGYLENMDYPKHRMKIW